MKTIEIKNANAIQNWGDEEEGGIYIFTSDGGSSGPFVMCESKVTPGQKYELLDIDWVPDK